MVRHKHSLGSDNPVRGIESGLRCTLDCIRTIQSNLLGGKVARRARIDEDASHNLRRICRLAGKRWSCVVTQGASPALTGVVGDTIDQYG